MNRHRRPPPGLAPKTARRHCADSTEEDVPLAHLRVMGLHMVMASGDGWTTARADVGGAMGTGTDVAMHSAPVALIKGDRRGITQARLLSQATIASMKQNLGFAFACNARGVPLAAGLLFPYTGGLLAPMIAALAESLGSASVIANALRLRQAALPQL